VDIVFGDDDTYYYDMRKTGYITVDIEMHEQDSRYYDAHRLLGYSIFASYLSLYSRDHRAVEELLSVPREPIDFLSRVQLSLRNRKSIREFVEMSGLEMNRTDPRRLLAIALRNAAWALTGFHVTDWERALDYLSAKGVLSERESTVCHSILEAELSEASRGEALRAAREVITSIVATLEAEETFRLTRAAGGASRG
jgi:hypothetical protein